MLGACSDLTMLGGPTDYDRHWLLIFQGAARLAAVDSELELLGSAEQTLIASCIALPAEPRRFLGRLLNRERIRLLAADWPDDASRTSLIASGWLAPYAFDDDPAEHLTWLTLDQLGRPGPKNRAVDQALADPASWQRYRALGPYTRLSDTAEHLRRAAIQLACGLHGPEPADLVRLALGHLIAPPHCPATATLAGRQPNLLPPYASRAHRDAVLAAQDYRQQASDLPVDEAIRMAVTHLAPLVGAALPLDGAHHRPAHQWARLLLDLASGLDDDDPLRRSSLRLLRSLPLDPALVRRLWREHWRVARPALRQAIAGHIATWSIWRSGEAWRWQLRGSGRRLQRGAEAWPVRSCSAWLDRSGDRVVAEGELVEAHALRQLQAEGWDGVHAEGSFWLGLTLTLAWSVIQHPVPGLPVAPLQVLPDDWRRYGFTARRAHVLADLKRRLVIDAIGVLRQSPLWPGIVDGVSFLGLPPLPPAAGLEAVCRHLPGLALARLVDRLLSQPIDAGGLPDLVVWRDDAVALWEVKSPGDALSDLQRAWLGWFACEGVAAGVINLTAKEQVQHDLFGQATVVTKPKRGPPVGQRRRSAATNWHLDGLHQPGTTRPLPIMAGTQVATSTGDIPLATQPGWTIDEALAYSSLVHNPVHFVTAPLAHVGYIQRRGRKVLSTRWHPVATNLCLLLAVRDEVAGAGGVAPVAHLILRRSGWLIDREAGPHEPAVVTTDLDLSIIDEAILRTPPDLQPPRPGDRLHDAGLDDRLGEQIAMLAGQPWALTSDAKGWVLQVPADAGVLWVADPIRRGDLPIGN